MTEHEINEIAGKLLASSGFKDRFELQTIVGGANNRVYIVSTGPHKFILKHYFSHPQDKRDRLKAEYGFIDFAWGRGIIAVPRPFSTNPTDNAALYEFIDGRKLRPDEVTQERVAEALDFYRSLNMNKDRAKNLPLASEACFSAGEHLELIGSRISKLNDISGNSPADKEALNFAFGDLARAWKDVSGNIRKSFGAALDELISDGERCVSPSDFGFHNALLEPGGTLRFIDFEYAGWDDPAKLACDFFCQPEVPVPEHFFPDFVSSVASGLPDPEKFTARATMLLPAYRIKWVSILLNEFLPAGSKRRRFAGMLNDPEEIKFRQLEKARALFNASLSRIGG